MRQTVDSLKEKMRLWSLHPRYLDSKGLVALWREALLARKVLEGKTVGYVNHPQLERFRKSSDPLRAINAYLFWVYDEARRRGYHFDETKLKGEPARRIIRVTSGQLRYEFEHLLKKVKRRDRSHLRFLLSIREKSIEPNPVFFVVRGGVEKWEKKVALGE